MTVAVITEAQIQNRLWCSMAQSQIVCPNFTPARWFECDVFSVSKAGYWTEHEIKLTAGDFRADAEKSQRYGRPRREDDPPGPFRTVHDELFKHNLLSAKDDRGPSAFYYVLPERIVGACELPEWAGLKIVRELSAGYLRITTEKTAPRLHKSKCAESVIEQAKIALYWRYWRARVFHNRIDPPASFATE